MSSKTATSVKTSTAVCRVPVFGLGQSIEVSTSWGSATIDGRRLTPRHHSVIDAVTTLARQSLTLQNGDEIVEVDSADIRKALGWRSWSYDQIDAALNDLENSSIEVRSKDGKRKQRAKIVIRFADSGVDAPKRRAAQPQIGRADVPAKEGREPPRSRQTTGGAVWHITVGAEWLALIRDQHTHYPRAVWRLPVMAQAVARFVLSHRDPRMHIDTVLESVGVVGHLSRTRKRLAKHKDALLAVGVALEQDPDNSYRGWVSRCEAKVGGGPKTPVSALSGPTGDPKTPVG